MSENPANWQRSTGIADHGGNLLPGARILRNLLDNAVRHAKSRIEIAVGATGDEAVLTVADDGPGIPATDRVRVFGRFVRLDTDRARAGGGTGLGLAIVAEVVAAHGGAIKIGERSCGGTVVTVTLPVRRVGAGSPAQVRTPGAGDPPLT